MTTTTYMAAVHLLSICVLIFSLHITPSLAVGEDVHLIEFKESLKDSSALDSTWIKGTNPCDRRKAWQGIDCSDTEYKAVSAILLMNLGLSGVSENLDIDALRNLQSLRFLSLENNSFSGPMPEFNRLSSLKSLFLSGNQFSGEIPPGFFEPMGSLKKLHLARNKFSGRIPDSLGKLNNIMEILLQNNEFSGPVPVFEQKTLQTIDLSYNKLQGEIPQSMSRFPAKAFEGNPDICGSVISKDCNHPEANTNASSPGDKANEANESGSMTKWVILAVVVAVLLVTILFKAKKKDENFTVLGKENLDEVVQVHVPSTNRRSMSSSSSRRGGNYNDSGSRSSKRGSQAGKSTNDLVVINEEKGVFGLPDLMKAAAEVLGSGGLGSAYKAVMANGVTVVVKRMRDMNKLNKDAFETEIRKLGRIRHRNILPPLAYHYRKEEKLLVTEFIPKGSLLFLLHGDRGIAHAELNWPTRLKIIKGVARGMGFLHTEFANYELPHGNLKSSNILLSPNYEPLLTDYALYSLISNTHSVQALFAYKCPEAVLYQQLSPKSDVYCLGIVILEIMTGKFPTQYLNNQKGGTDVVQWVRQAISEGRVAELIDPEIANTTSSLEQMEKMLHIGATCTESDHEKRIEMREAIRNIEEVQV
ncbi:Serine/threonine protein kinase [Handroanthus impetiginosus]|uniref:Serine/threonine protein kinase n=1 Tax=Handroanthus impetiginosus TaxID=429701 RepID=A0A2G9H181_9LAMI|nr:Serine/threonine protein kinase [Handroanthus impetiginosus]